MLEVEHVDVFVEPVLNQVTCVSWSAVLLVPVSQFDHPRLDHISQDVEINGVVDVLAFSEEMRWHHLTHTGGYDQHVDGGRIISFCRSQARLLSLGTIHLSF